MSVFRSRGRVISALTAAALALTTATAARAAAAGPAPAARTTPAATAPAAGLNLEQASALARRTGRPVTADALTTPLATTVANSNGTFTRTSSTEPVRIRRDGAWTPLSATLAENADGTISPAATTAALRLSGGGTAPLAVLDYGGRTLSITLPVKLPAPTLAGDTATYASVLPGINLVVTANTRGGFSETLVVATAEAAANPALPGLLTYTVGTTGGLTVHADADGVLEADAGSGQAVFTAPDPMAWDSATAAGARSAAGGAPAPMPGGDGAGAPANPGTASSPGSPGSGAHLAELKPSYSGHTLTLAEPAALISGPSTAFPLFFDPSWGPVATSGGVPSWTSVNSYYPNQSYPDKSMGQSGEMQVGYCGDTSDPDPCNPVDVSRTFLTLNTSGVPAGATIQSTGTAVNLLENWSASCTAREVDLYQTGTISTSTDWNDQPAWLTKLGGQTAAHGNSGSCPSAGVGFTGSAVTAAFQSAVGRPTLTVGLQAANESDDMAWKQFAEADTTLSEVYDLPPSFGALTTSPATNCSGGSTVGLGSLALDAAVDSAAGNNLSTSFALYKSGSTTNLLAGAAPVSGGNTTATLLVGQSVFTNAVGSTPTVFTWNATTTDGTLSAPSPTCTFTYDPTVPGQPGVAVTNPLPKGDADCTDNAQARVAMGSTCSFAVTAPAGTTPSAYAYQLNTDAPVTVTPSAGGAPTDIAFTVNQVVNTLTVWALSAGGNVGQRASVPFLAAYPATATTDGDLTGAGVPDLIVPGGTGALPPGLWYSPGNTDGSLSAASVNIGTAGLSSAGSAGDWTGTEASTGTYCQDNVQDVLDYNPGTGGAGILCNDGSADPLTSTSPANGGSAPPVMTPGTFNDNGAVPSGQQTNSGNAVQIVNAGDTAATDGGGGSVEDDDLLAVMDNELYLYSAAEPGGYDTFDGFSSDVLAATDSPDGSMDWDSWTLASTQIDGATDLYLWDRSTGALDLWTGLSAGAPGAAFPNATTLNAADQYPVAGGWNIGTGNLVLRAGDLGGAPVLWAVDTTDGSVSTYVPNASDTALTSPATSPQKLVTSAHDWQLSDAASGNVATAADTTSGTPLPLTGNGNAAWNSDGQFSPDVSLNGTSGYLSAAGLAVNLAQSFTVSAWADPLSPGGALLSQDGSADSGFTVSPASGGWAFALNTGSGTAATFTTITGGSVDLGAWSRITATYNSATTVMDLFVNGTLVASGNSAPPATGAGGGFVVGAALNAGSRAGTYFHGQVAQVQTWNAPQPPAQPATPAGYHQSVTPTRILDTRGSTGAALTDGTTTAGDPVAPGATVALQISGDPVAGGTEADIPSSVTAVAVDLTATSESSAGFVTAYADGTQRPITSCANYMAATTVTCYQIVPVGADGRIDLYNGGGFNASTHLIVDVTGYFTSDATLAGDQTYHPLASAQRVLSGTSGSLAGGGTVAVGIRGVDGIPDSATAVAVNLTASSSSGSSFLEAYATNSAPVAATTLSYTPGGSVASMAGDVPIGSGGSITVANEGGTGTQTTVTGDVSGYYTTDMTGLAYHTANPTRLVDTRVGIGGSIGAVAAQGTYTVTATATGTVTTNPDAVLDATLTVTQPTSAGSAVAYPAGQTLPGTSNLNWTANQTIANSTLTPVDATGRMSIYNASAGTAEFVLDSSGYFAPGGQAPAPAPNHQWKLSEGTGTAIDDSAGAMAGDLSQSGASWSTSGRPALQLDGTSGYAETDGTAVDTAGSFTVSAWVELTSVPSGNATALSEFGDENSPFYLQANSGSWAFVISDGDTADPTLDGPNGPYDVVAYTWYHITGVYDAGTETAQIYVDGQLVGSQSGLTTWGASGDLDIGRDLYTGLQVDYFPGEISDVETWNSALSPGQVATLD